MASGGRLPPGAFVAHGIDSRAVRGGEGRCSDIFQGLPEILHETWPSETSFPEVIWAPDLNFNLAAKSCLYLTFSRAADPKYILWRKQHR